MCVAVCVAVSQRPHSPVSHGTFSLLQLAVTPVLQCVLQCVLSRVLQCALQCVLHCVLQFVLQYALHCVLQCVLLHMVGSQMLQ